MIIMVFYVPLKYRAEKNLASMSVDALFRRCSMQYHAG
jgi:hypothetical protein